MSTAVKDWLERVVRTFIGAFVVAFVVPVTNLYDLAAWKGAAMTALLTGVTAVIGFVGMKFGPSGTTSVVTALKPKAAVDDLPKAA